MTLQRKTGLKRTPLKTSQPNRDWSKAIEKRDEEGCCRVCGATQNVEAAHTLSRDWDKEVVGPRGGKVLVVEARDIVPLCGPSTSSDTCHGKHHRHELNLLGLISYDEEAAVVKKIGLAAAYRVLTGGGKG